VAIRLSAAALLMLGMSSPALADTSAQPTVLSTTSVYEGSGSGDASDPSFFTVNVEPFDASVGTLVSFTVKWEFEGTLAGAVADGATSASVSGEFGGTFSFNGNAFAGGQGIGTAEAAPGEAISLTYRFPTYERTFPASQAGLQYDPAFLQAVQGSTPFTLEAKRGTSSFASVAYTDVAGLKSAIKAKATVTYHYTPLPSPGDSALKITSLLPSPAVNSAALTWTSQTGTTYSIDASDNLTDWQTLGFGLPATPPANAYTEKDIPTGDHRFYRVRSRK
jgi:hypothetical protein